MNQAWKVIIVLLGIFAAGAVTGGFVTLRVWRNKVMNRPVAEEWTPKHLKRLVDRLDLTAAQQDQVRPVIRRNLEEVNRLRNANMTEIRTVVEGMQREISEQLTPEQRVKFEQMNRELREAREAREKAERAKRVKAEQPRDRPPGDKPPPDKPPGE